MSTPREADPLGRPSSRLGLRARLILWLGVPLLAILAGSSALDYRTARQIADQVQDQNLADSLYDLEAHLKSEPGDAPLDLGDEARAMLRSSAPDVLYYAVRDAEGRLLIGDADVPRDMRQIALGQPTYADAVYRGRPVRVAALRADVHGRELDVTVAQTTERRRSTQRQLLAAMVWPNLAVVGVTLLVVLFGVRLGLKPLQKVEEEIARRSASDLRPFDLASVPSEIRPMLGRLNELFVLLQKASHLQQRFIADAAHQLKTPLAGLRNQVDLALGEGALPPDRAWLAGIDAATGRLGHLLEQLLAYAHAEASESADAAVKPVALDRLVEEAASQFLDSALAKDIDLGFDIAPAAVTGIRWMLREALSNLIDNAIQYSPRGSVVTVRCAYDAGRPFVEVQDNGPGIPPEQQQRVLERFYRMPGSAGDGCGLGLAIVHEIASRHGARLEMHSAAGAGLRVRLGFPPALGAAGRHR